MAIKQSQYFKGNARTPVPHPCRKGEVIEYMFTHTFDETLGAGDILDLFPVFPYGRIVGFDFASENVGAVALTIGLMSGLPASKDDTRTVSNQLIDGVSAAAGGVTGLPALSYIPDVGETAVSVGVSAAAEIAADTAKKLHVRIRVVS